MPLLYGSPLPPGVEAPTRGELRIRVDKLLIDHASVNQNPLVSFHFGAPNPSLDSLTGSHTISPNRFVVPVDYCAVSPLFWGEEKPSVSCQPSTAQHHRGSFTLVYPVKVEESAFQKYLKNMTASSHQGLQFEVTVPSSYSGRPPVLIGKCILPLDSLTSPEASSSFAKNILHGWFSVLHQSKQHAPGGMEGDSPPSSTLTVPIGKLKLHVHLYYFTKPPRKVLKRREKSDTSGPDFLFTADDPGDREDARENLSHPPPAPSVAGLNTSVEGSRGDTSLSSHGGALSDHPSVEVERVIPLPPPPPVETPTETISPPSSGSSTALLMRELLRKGAELRRRMGVASSSGFLPLSLGEAALPSSGVGSVPLPPMPPAGARVSFPDDPRGGWRARRREGEGEGEGDVETDADDLSSQLYTSEESDAEEFMLQLQKDHAATRKGEAASLSPAAGSATPTAVGVKDPSSVRLSPPLDSHSTLVDAHRTVVEMRFTDVSFPSTRMTEDLEEIRINVRLSKDITVESPVAGPFSSFVHHIPLTQSTIRLSFVVCFFSEKNSRLVIEFIKVKSQPRRLDSTVERAVLSEELLGLCIVGMFAQSREIVLRDPVSGENNVFCHLDLELFAHGRGRVKARMRSHAAPPPRREDSNPRRISSLEEVASSSTAGSSSDRVEGEISSREHLRKAISSRDHEKKAIPSRDYKRKPISSRDYERKAISSSSSVEESVSSSDRKEGAASSRPRVRLCVRIHDVQGLPCVALDGDDGKKGKNDGDEGDGFTAPNPFVVVDALTAADGSFLTGWRVDPPASWDRTAVVFRSRRPFFGYRGVLRLAQKGGVEEGGRLGALRLTLWHYAGEEMPQGGEGENGGGEESEEVRFWSHAALMGSCRVDLRPLKYLNQLEGYYRVVREEEGKKDGGGYPTRRVEQAGEATEAGVVGYIHVSVNLL
ncbi:unnamed protein product [Phytomonas sp. EM1]|nr:unnamed protein product [Phytomonas sp. EM1]|eukprot:CCW60588.1 unnamed protein product [Phytomonas sp. isolate EM1]